MEIRPAAQSLTVGGETRYASLWTVSDLVGNVVLRLTDHQHDIVRGGQTFKSASAVDSSNREYLSEAGPSDVQVVAAFDSDGIDAELLSSRLHDGGTVLRQVVDFMYPDESPFDEATFLIQDTSGDEDTASITMATLESLLDVAAGWRHTKKCRHKFTETSLGEGCEATAATYAHTSTIDSVTASLPNLQFVTTIAGVTGFEGLKWGRVKFTSGDNDGFISEIRTASDASPYTIELQLPTPFQMQAGDTIEVMSGCPGNSEACTHYGQELNFGGFVDIAGDDSLGEIGDTGEGIEG